MKAINSCNAEPSIGDDQPADPTESAVAGGAGGDDGLAASVDGLVGAARPALRRVRPARTASTTTASAINRTATAISTVPRPIPDCTAAGGVAGTTV
jgi:hypothetical protein